MKEDVPLRTRVRSSEVEQLIADQSVTGSSPVVPFLLHKSLFSAPSMDEMEVLGRLKEISARAKELDSKLLETAKSFESCAGASSEMEAISSKIAKVFALYRDLVGLLNK